MSLIFCKFLLISVFYIINGNCQEFEKKLKLDILFESLCPDSEAFVQELESQWNTIAPHCDIKFIPFGKSASLPDGRFICQHGPLECRGNRIMSCALSRIPEQTKQVKFVACFMKNYRTALTQVFYEFSSDPSIQNCASQVGLDFNDALDCFRTKEGTSLQLQAESFTKMIKPSFVPTVLYDKKFDQNLQDKSISDFRGTVCQVLQQKSIADCPSLNFSQRSLSNWFLR